jgi:hypothetical protein
MPRPPTGDRPQSSTERTRATRERQQAAGLPDREKVQRAIAKAATALSEVERQHLLAAVLDIVPADQRQGFDTATRALLNLPHTRSADDIVTATVR